MRSPLPDSGNLEAGIVEDSRPSRLSRVHDNVRDLLRRSVQGNGSAAISPASPWTNSHDLNILPSPVTAKSGTEKQSPRSNVRPTSTTDSTPTTPPEEIPGVLFPPWRHQEPANRPDTAAVDNTRAAAANDHPDLSSPALSVFIHQKQIERQQQAWKRRHAKPRKHKQERHRNPPSNAVQWTISIILACVVCGLLGTCKYPPSSKQQNYATQH